MKSIKSTITILFLLLFSYQGVSQSKTTLDDLLLKGYQSKDSSQFYFSSATQRIKTKADSASYFYFKFYRKYKDKEKDSAIYFSEKVIPLYKQLDTLERLRRVYEQLHYQELYSGEYERALDYIQKALTVAEKMKDTTMISLALTDKSNVYHDFEAYEKGVAYGKKAFKILYEHDSTNYKYLIFANNVIAINFDDWKKPDSALFYHYKNLKYIPKTGDSLRYGFVLNNIGNTLLKEKKFSQAKKIINRSLAINKIRKQDYNLATNYTNLATIAYEQDRYENAIAYFEQANFHAKESQTIEKIRDVTQQEAWYYKKMGNYKKALERQEAFYKLRDSVFNDERAAKVAEIETKYEIEKKEKQLAQTRATLAESELEIKQKNNLLYGSLGLVLILGLLGYLFYNQQKLKNRQLKKEGELKTALAKIETQNRLQEQRLRISRDLHDNIGSQLTFVTSSVDNLKFGLQEKDTTTSKKLTIISAFTTQTIYELRDTIWAMNKSKITFEDLQSRIANFIEKANASGNEVEFSFNISEDISKDSTFSSVQGMNMYRIIQEAVNNALKYAEASAVAVEINKAVSSYTLKIVDNGKGFNLDTMVQGNGLKNIKKRAKDLDGTFKISSSNENGTTVEVVFKA